MRPCPDPNAKGEVLSATTKISPSSEPKNLGMLSRDFVYSFRRLQRPETLFGGFARPVVAEPLEGMGEIGLRLFTVLRDEVCIASNEVAVTPLPEGPLRDVFIRKLRDNVNRLGSREEDLHLRRLLYRWNWDPHGECIGLGVIFEGSRSADSLFESDRFLIISKLPLSQGKIDRKRLGGLAQLGGFTQRDDKIADGRIHLKRMRSPIVEMRELQRFMETIGASR